MRQQQEEEEQVGQKNPVKMTVAVTSQEGPEIAAVYSQVEKMAASLTISRKVEGARKPGMHNLEAGLTEMPLPAGYGSIVMMVSERVRVVELCMAGMGEEPAVSVTHWEPRQRLKEEAG